MTDMDSKCASEWVYNGSSAPLGYTVSFTLDDMDSKGDTTKCSYRAGLSASLNLWLILLILSRYGYIALQPRTVTVNCHRAVRLSHFDFAADRLAASGRRLPVSDPLVQSYLLLSLP